MATRGLTTAAALIPPHPSLTTLQEAAADARPATSGRPERKPCLEKAPAHAKAMLVGEQPGNDEDLKGHPFVGPAGRILDKALAEVGIDRNETYVTNVVKHFKWEPRGKGRIHAKPNAQEIAACLPWLEAEIAAVQPLAVVCLGATAAQALLGRQFRVTRQRGELISSSLARYVMATVHPSSILRARDEDSRHQQMRLFVDDLKKLAETLRKAA